MRGASICGDYGAPEARTPVIMWVQGGPAIFWTTCLLIQLSIGISSSSSFIQPGGRETK